MTVGAYFAGVGLALCTTCMSAMGLTLQKLSHRRLETRREIVRRQALLFPHRHHRRVSHFLTNQVKKKPLPASSTTSSTTTTSTTSTTTSTTTTGATASGTDPRSISNTDQTHDDNEDDNDDDDESPEEKELRAQEKALKSWRQPLWLAGIALMIISSLLSLAVFALVGQAVASCFAAVTLVWNVIFGRFILHEQLTMLDIGITVLLLTGAIITVSFGAQQNPDQAQAFLDVEIINDYFVTSRVYIFSAILGPILLFAMAWIYWVDERRKVDKKVPYILFGATAFLRPFIAGIFSATTGICSKGFTSIISAEGKGSGADNFASPDFYLFLFFLPLSLVLQIGYLNSGLRNFDATLIVPIYQSLIVVFGVVFGFIYWNEGESMGANIAGFIAGIVIIVFGLFLLLFKPRATSKIEDVMFANGGEIGLLGGAGGGGGLFTELFGTNAIARGKARRASDSDILCLMAYGHHKSHLRNVEPLFRGRGRVIVEERRQGGGKGAGAGGGRGVESLQQYYSSHHHLQNPNYRHNHHHHHKTRHAGSIITEDTANAALAENILPPVIVVLRLRLSRDILGHETLSFVELRKEDDGTLVEVGDAMGAFGAAEGIGAALGIARVKKSFGFGSGSSGGRRGIRGMLGGALGGGTAESTQRRPRAASATPAPQLQQTGASSALKLPNAAVQHAEEEGEERHTNSSETKEVVPATTQNSKTSSEVAAPPPPPTATTTPAASTAPLRPRGGARDSSNRFAILKGIGKKRSNNTSTTTISIAKPTIATASSSPTSPSPHSPLPSTPLDDRLSKQPLLIDLHLPLQTAPSSEPVKDTRYRRILRAVTGSTTTFRIAKPAPLPPLDLFLLRRALNTAATSRRERAQSNESATSFTNRLSPLRVGSLSAAAAAAAAAVGFTPEQQRGGIEVEVNENETETEGIEIQTISSSAPTSPVAYSASSRKNTITTPPSTPCAVKPNPFQQKIRPISYSLGNNEGISEIVGSSPSSPSTHVLVTPSPPPTTIKTPGLRVSPFGSSPSKRPIGAGGGGGGSSTRTFVIPPEQAAALKNMQKQGSFARLRAMTAQLPHHAPAVRRTPESQPRGGIFLSRPLQTPSSFSSLSAAAGEKGNVPTHLVIENVARRLHRQASADTLPGNNDIVGNNQGGAGGRSSSSLVRSVTHEPPSTIGSLLLPLSSSPLPSSAVAMEGGNNALSRATATAVSDEEYDEERRQMPTVVTPETGVRGAGLQLPSPPPTRHTTTPAKSPVKVAEPPVRFSGDDTTTLATSTQCPNAAAASSASLSYSHSQQPFPSLLNPSSSSKVAMPDMMRMGVGVLPSGFSLPVASEHGGIVSIDARLLVAILRAPHVTITREKLPRKKLATTIAASGGGGGNGIANESTSSVPSSVWSSNDTTTQEDAESATSRGGNVIARATEGSKHQQQGDHTGLEMRTISSRNETTTTTTNASSAVPPPSASSSSSTVPRRRRRSILDLHIPRWKGRRTQQPQQPQGLTGPTS